MQIKRKHLILFSLFSWLVVFPFIGKAQRLAFKFSPGKILSVRSLAVSAEYGIQGPHSVALGYSRVIPWNALNTASLLRIPTSGEEWELNEARLTGYNITPEYRYYIQEEVLQSVYVGFFLKQFQYNSAGEISLDINNITGASFASNLRMRGTGIGAQGGWSKVWDSGVSFDVNVGLGISATGLRLQGTFTNIAQDELQPAFDRVNEFLDGIPIFNVELPNEQTINVNRRVAFGAFPILRSTISIGFAL